MSSRGTVVLAAMLATIYAMPTTPRADAATVFATTTGGGLLYLAGSGETNHVIVTKGGGSYTFTESGPGTTLTPTGACTGSATVVNCPSNNKSELDVLAGNLDDSVGVSSGVSIYSQLFGETGDDLLVGGAGNDTLDGGGGFDTLRGGPGADTLTDAGGIATADYSDHIAPVSVSLGGAAGSAGGSEDGLAGSRDSLSADTRHIIGGSGDDDLTGNGNVNTLNGGSGDDTLDGKAGDDVLVGGLGSDFSIGGPGTDLASYGDRSADMTVALDGSASSGGAGERDAIQPDVENALGGSGNDSLIGANNVDNVLNGGPGNDVLDGGVGPDTLIGGTGRDTASYARRSAAVSVTLGTGPDDGEVGEGDDVAGDVEGAIGGDANDTLIGAAGDGTFDGGAGDDLLDGGAGADILIGGSGRDTADYTSRVGPVAVDLSSPGGDGEAGEGDDVNTDDVAGGSGDDVLTGDGSANSLIGGPGNDRLGGQGGADVLLAGQGADGLAGGPGNDLLFGGDGNDTLAGDPGADSLNGEAGDDALDGGAGADVFNGGPGTDLANYGTRSVGLSLTIDGTPDDGEPGEQDNLRTDVENLVAGSGNDTVGVANEVRNDVNCGAGDDSASADRVDTLANCEHVAVDSPTLVILTSMTKVTRTGRVVVSLRCQGRHDMCAGTLSLQTAKPVSAKRHKRRKRRLDLGRAQFSISAGRTEGIMTRLAARGRRLVRRSRKLTVRVIASPKAEISSFKAIGKSITLKPTKAKHRRARKGGRR